MTDQVSSPPLASLSLLQPRAISDDRECLALARLAVPAADKTFSNVFSLIRPRVPREKLGCAARIKARMRAAHPRGEDVIASVMREMMHRVRTYIYVCVCIYVSHACGRTDRSPGSRGEGRWCSVALPAQSIITII
jgi:hypothetical protein